MTFFFLFFFLWFLGCPHLAPMLTPWLRPWMSRANACCNGLPQVRRPLPGTAVNPPRPYHQEPVGACHKPFQSTVVAGQSPLMRLTEEQRTGHVAAQLICPPGARRGAEPEDVTSRSERRLRRSPLMPLVKVDVCWGLLAARCLSESMWGRKRSGITIMDLTFVVSAIIFTLLAIVAATSLLNGSSPVVDFTNARSYFGHRGADAAGGVDQSAARQNGYIPEKKKKAVEDWCELSCSSHDHWDVVKSVLSVSDTGRTLGCLFATSAE